MKRLQLSAPRSPFATRLSGSAKETELRIRNIFQWKKQRPPVWLMALALLVILACGGLVSCQSQPPASSAAPAIVMEAQYYDTSENYIEIPTLVPPDDSDPSGAVAAINQALASLKAEYQPILDGEEDLSRYGLMELENQCLFYPSTTGRYLNLVFFRDEFHTDLNTGHVFSLVYDLEEERQATMEEALALAGMTEEGLFAQLSEQFDGYLQPDLYAYIQDPVLEGFRMDADGQPVFYLTARMDDDPDNDWLSGADNMYIWSDGSFTCYDQYSPDAPQALVPAGETDTLDPPLWCQWYFAGGEPEGGFTPAPGDPAPEEEVPDIPNAPEGPVSDSAAPKTDMRSAYADILARLIRDDIAPSGESPVLYADDPEFNRFALYDVDGDGKEELVLLYASTVYSGYSGYVLAYDETAGSVRTQFLEFPLLTFYDNGVVTAGWSHNQGLGGAFWPYTLYQYDSSSDSYTQVGSVDAWDKSLSDENPDNLPPFPTELDVSGTGFLYYIRADGYDGSTPVDASVYQTWLNGYIGSASELKLPYQTMTEENIQNLRSGA